MKNIKKKIVKLFWMNSRHLLVWTFLYFLVLDLELYYEFINPDVPISAHFGYPDIQFRVPNSGGLLFF